MPEMFKLYGMTASLYTAKVRAYMRQNRVPFQEIKAGSEHYSHVVKNAVGRWIVPVIETPGGEYIQDGTVILDYFETNGFSKKSIFPEDPIVKVIAHLFELFGSEGLLRPAMHYRWNFDETNLEFLKVAFADVLPDGLTGEAYDAAFEHASGRMRHATLFFGAVPETQNTVERAYAEFLSLLNAHFSEWPFLLGGRACVGDYAMFGPLWAHLGRDPAPLHLMQKTAPRVHRWTERMNMSENYVDEISLKAGDRFFSEETIPETLKSLMRYVSEEYLPEITAHVDFANEWLENNPDPGQTHSPKQRAIGMANFKWRGHQINSAVMPYRFFLLQRLQDAFDELNSQQKGTTQSLFNETGLGPMLVLRTTRRVIRRDHLEVWDEAN